MPRAIHLSRWSRSSEPEDQTGHCPLHARPVCVLVFGQPTIFDGFSEAALYSTSFGFECRCARGLFVGERAYGKREDYPPGNAAPGAAVR